MRAIRVFGLVGLLAVLAAPASRAHSTRNFGTQCFVGAFKACASVSVTLRRVHRNGFMATQVLVRVSNLQGTPGFDWDDFQGLESLSIRNLHPDRVPPDGYIQGSEGSTMGNAGGYPAVDVYWRGDRNGQLFMVPDPGLQPYPVFGCNQPSAYFGTGFSEIGPLYTCGGSITFEVFAWETELKFTSATDIELKWQTYNDDGTWTAGGDCITGSTCVEVPEPMTVALLATGLVGMGGVGALRRRRKPDEV